jgi:hypothetical protein
MADGNEVAPNATKTNLDHPAVTPTATPVDGHTAKLQADSVHPTGDSTGVKDTTHTGDKALDKVKDTTETPAVDSFTHLTNAQQAANEIASYVKAGKKETDTVTIKGPDGADHTVNVADHIKDLKKIVDSECGTAVTQSNNIKQADVAPLLQAARNERNALAAQLKLDPDTLSKATIADARKGTTDSATAAKLDQLAQMQTKVDTYKLWENAPAYTRMLYASFKAAGLTDPDTGMQKDKNGGLKASQKDVLDAVQLLSEAGTSKDLRSSRLYVEAVSTVLPKLENSSAKVQTITQDLQDATKAGAKGDTKEQERLLKDAVSQADQTNTAAIAQMLRDPRFVASQRDPAILQDMASNAVMSSTARLQYAQFLMDQGKFADAQGLVLRVKTELPEVMYTADPNTPGKINYNQSRFVNMDTLDHEAAASSAVQANDIRNHLDGYLTAMKNGQITGKGGAQEIMTNLYAAASKRVADIKDGQKGLDTAQQQLEQKKNDLAAKKYLTDDAKTLEQKQIDREQAMIQQQRAYLGAQALDANQSLNGVKLYNAQMDVSVDNRADARRLLAEVKIDDPALAAEKDAHGQDTFYAQLEKGAKEPSWWDSNWRKVAIGGAIVAGLAVGVATCYLGPGAVLAGVGTTTSLISAIGAGTVVVGAATAGGALGFLGTHEAIHSTGVLSKDVNVGRDLLDGAKIGAVVGVGVISVPLTAAALSMAPEATVAARLAMSARIGTIGLVANSGKETLNYFSQDAKDRSVLGSAKNALGDSVYFAATPFIAPVGALFGKIPGIPAAGRVLGSLLGGSKVVPAAAEVADLAPAAASESLNVSAQVAAEAPSLLPSAVNAARPALKVADIVGPLIWVGIDQGTESHKNWQDADQQGPAYFHNDDGSVGEVENGAIFGPQRPSRGLEPGRDGELATIMRKYTDVDPGVNEADALISRKAAVPIVNTTSDVTDAEHPDTSAGPGNH